MLNYGYPGVGLSRRPEPHSSKGVDLCALEGRKLRATTQIPRSDAVCKFCSPSPELRILLLCGSDLLESFCIPGLWNEADVSNQVTHEQLGVGVGVRERPAWLWLLSSSPSKTGISSLLKVPKREFIHMTMRKVLTYPRLCLPRLIYSHSSLSSRWEPWERKHSEL